MISETDQITLSGSKISIVGMGGLGCYIAEQFARLGIGGMRLVDEDVFDISNLNRQLYCTEETIGKKKAAVASQRVREINDLTEVEIFNCRLNEENGAEILGGSELVFGAVDNTRTRLVLEKACEALGITLIDGAIGGWFGQIAVVMPGERALSKIYMQDSDGEEIELGNPSFICGVAASIQVSEGIKQLLFGQSRREGKVLTIDLFNHRFEEFKI